jgi:capsular exopolysaccharide synthesis family protein
MKETDITEELLSSNVSVIDLAEVPKSPINAKKKYKILFIALMGLGLGVGVSFFLEYLDNTIKSTEDVERYLALPVLGALERFKVLKDTKQNSTELIAEEFPKSTFAEAVKNIRTGIIFSSTDNSRKSILITSATQGEGKTFVASNLAITIAHAGKNTLLVETDFRRPRINKIFNVEMNPGLSNHLVGENDLESVIKSTSIRNLSVITCGNIPPNPSEMLGSVRMEEFCKIVREKFDTVLFDTPPSLTVTDATVLSNVIDEAVFVIRSGKTARETAKRATLQISKNKCKLLGVVVNFINVSKGSYYYHYYSGYHKDGDNGKETSNEAEKV